MLRSFLLLLCASFAGTVFSQSTSNTLEQIYRSMRNYDRQFVCSTENGKSTALSTLGFDTLYEVSTGRILSSSQDFLKNGRAVTLDFNEAIKRLSINYTWRRRGEDRGFWNFGFTAEESSKKLFEIFGKDGWKDGFTFSIGRIMPICKQTLFFLPNDCDTLRRQRHLQYLKLLNEYAAVLQTNTDTIKSLIARRKASSDFRWEDVDNTYSQSPVPLTDAEKKLLESWEKIQLYVTSTASEEAIVPLYNQAIRDFEASNFKSFGYSMHWLNYGLSFGMKRHTTFDTAVVRLAEIKKGTQPRVSGSFSYNYFRESAYKRITFFTGEFSAGNTNFFDEMLPSDIVKLKATTPEGTITEEYNALVIKDYNKLKKGYGFFSVGGTYNYFPCFGKRIQRFIGLELAASTKFKLFVPNGVPAQNVFSARGGLLFTFEKDKIAKTTFGILATFTDIPFNDLTSKNRFGVNIRIGVPFNY